MYVLCQYNKLHVNNNYFIIFCAALPGAFTIFLYKGIFISALPNLFPTTNLGTKVPLSTNTILYLWFVQK